MKGSSLPRLIARSARPSLSRLRRDGRIYLSNVRPGGRDVRKFCVICTPRTGSTLLCDLLDTHPRIHCEQEILMTIRDVPSLYVRGSALRAGRRGMAAYGFKANVMSAAIRQTSPSATWCEFVSTLAADGFLFIRLRRRNLLRQAISTARARETRFHSTADDEAIGPVSVDVPDLFRAVVLYDNYDQIVEEAVREFPHLDLVYEDDLEQASVQQATADRVCGFIGVEPAQVTTKFVKTGTRRLEDSICNLDDVARAFQGTKFAEHLDD